MRIADAPNTVASALSVILSAALGAGWATLGLKRWDWRQQPAAWLASRWLWNAAFWGGLLLTMAVTGWGLAAGDFPWTGPTCFEHSFRPSREPAQCVSRALPLLILGSNLALFFHLAGLRLMAGLVLREPWDRIRLASLLALVATVSALPCVGWVYQPATLGLDSPMAKPWYGGLLGDGFSLSAVMALAMGALLCTVFWIHRRSLASPRTG